MAKRTIELNLHCDTTNALAFSKFLLQLAEEGAGGTIERYIHLHPGVDAEVLKAMVGNVGTDIKTALPLDVWVAHAE